jgi:NAD(P)-dependent dehydrogenase (short-subunit alcohol dehydrogenase family)
MGDAAGELRFDGRVAVVTGGGRGLGRAHALLLAARGAKVVVNDVGAPTRSGEGHDPGPAEQVVAEIKAAGGEAVANSDTVATPAGGQAIIAQAMDTWGRLDILVQNAGNSRRNPLQDFTQEDFDAMLDVHLRGAFHVVSPAYKVMHKAQYGRVVMTASNAALYGAAGIVAYCTAKAGITGMCNVVAREGAAHNIKANCILPGGLTRLADGRDTSGFPATMAPETTSPMVGWLAHESCPVTGQYWISMAGRVARAYWAETPGVWRPDWTIEDVAREAPRAGSEGEPWVLDDPLTAFEDHILKSFAMNPGKVGFSMEKK